MNTFAQAQYGATDVSMHQRNFGLDLVRAGCTILVVFNHINNYISEFSSICKYTFPIGYVAQDTFFGLSGFLIAKNLLKVGSGKMPASTFMIYRWVRTIPLYYVFLVINYSLFIFLYRHSNEHLFANTSFSLSDYFLFIQNFHGQHPSFYPEIWPIAIEEWCFLLYPMVLILVTKFFAGHKNNAVERLILMASILILIMSIVRGLRCYDPGLNIDWGIRKVATLRMDALAYGVLMYALTVKFNEFIQRNAGILALFGGIAALAVSFAERIWPDPMFNVTIFTLIPAFSVLVLPFFYYRTFKVLPASVKGSISHISLISYSILLCHLYFIQFLMLMVFKPLSLSESILFTLVYFGTVFLFSTWVYNTVERPLMAIRPKASEIVLNLRTALLRRLKKGRY